MKKLGPVVILCALIAVGCSRRGHESTSVLRYPLTVEPGSFDPAVVNESGTGELLQNIYDGLVQFGADDKVEPALAESWDVSPDGRTYTFHLRDAAFHNARKFSANDVKYSFERALWPETKSSSATTYFAGILGVADVAAGRRKDLAGIRVVDPRTVQITLDRPRGYFLSALTFYTGLIVCKEAIESNGGRLDEHSAVGTGPFKPVEYRHGAKVALAANPSYWGGRPNIERIERPIVLDLSTRHVMYENGEIDLTAVSSADYLRDNDDPQLKAQLRDVPTPTIIYLMMHPKLVAAFADPRVRRAFALAIDKDEIVRVASHGLWSRADSLLPPGMPGRDPNPPKTALDPAEARKLLAEAGYPDGKGVPQVTLTYTQNQPERAAMAQIIRSDLQRNLGITIALQEREGVLFVQDRRAEKMPFYIGVWDVDYPDPQNVLSTLLRTGAPLNNFGYSNPAVDSLLDRADSEPAMEKRIPLYREADRIAVHDCALIPLVYPSGRLLVKPYVTGWRHNLMGMLPHTKTRIGSRP